MYFVALVCPQEVNEKILRFKLWMKEHFGCVVALRSPSHITLIPPFWIEEVDEPLLVDTLHSFATNIKAVQILIDGFSHFGKRVLFAAVKSDPELERLRNEIEAHFITTFFNILKEERAFHPHLTIANRDLRPGDFTKAWQYFANKTFSEVFEIRVISILKHVDGAWKIIADNK